MLEIVYQHPRAVMAVRTFYASNEDVCIIEKCEGADTDVSQRLEIDVDDELKRL